MKVSEDACQWGMGGQGGDFLGLYLCKLTFERG